MFYRDKETGKIRLGNPEKKPAVTKSEPLGLLPPLPEIPKGDARIRILKGVFVNGRHHDPGEEVSVDLEIAMLLKADGKAQVLTLLPPREPEEHPFKAMAIAKVTARMRGVAAGATNMVDWIKAPLGKRFNPFVW